MTDPRAFKNMELDQIFPKAIILNEYDEMDTSEGNGDPLATPTLKFLDEVRRQSTNCISAALNLHQHRLVRTLQAIKRKSLWETKVHDGEIVAKWRAETDLRQELFDYAMEELRFCAKIKSESGGLVRWQVDGTWVCSFIDNQFRSLANG